MMKPHFKNLLQKIVLRVARLIGLFYLFAMIIVYFFMGKVLFHGTSLAQDHQFHFDRPFEEKWIQVGEEKVHSLYFSSSPNRGLILYFHGNAGDLDGWGLVAQELSAAAQMDVWIVDYPGFGKSPGVIKNEEQLYRFAEAMWADALKMYPEEKLVIYGRSLGTGVATRLAAHKKPALVLLETPYESVLSMVQARVPLMPEFAIPFRFRSDENVKYIDGKKLAIIHGTADEVIPYSQAQALVARIPEAKLHTVQNGGHNNLLDFPEFIEARANIFREYFGAK